MPLVRCRDCDSEISDSAASCPRCGRRFEAPAVRVVNFDVPMGDLVVFCLKLLVAAVPALLLLAIVQTMCSGVRR